MPRVSPLQNSFVGGEFSPLLLGRVDVDRYSEALKTCLNYVPILQGTLLRRPGTKYVADVKDSTKSTRLVDFEFSVTQAYVIEFGDLYLRFFRNNGQITSGGSPYEISSPYLEADLFQLKFTQSADILYIVHPSYAPRKLSRTDHTAWTLTKISFQDGPYLPVNTTATTMGLSGTTGSVTVTASATTGINDDTGFQTTDVGRLIRWKDPAGEWTWLEITAHTDTKNVTATIQGQNASATTATVNWRLGAWSDTTSYPSCVTFHENRLTFSGAPEVPQRVDFSESADFESFAPTDPDGTLTDAHAISATLNANQVNVVRWLDSDDRGLLAGTAGGEWLVSPSRQGEALTPTNVNAKRSTAWGSADIDSLRVGRASMFVQRSGRKLREINYFIDADGHRTVDLTLLAEHVVNPSLVELVSTKVPHPIIWSVRSDGMLLGLTYEREFETLKAGWHRHQVGGVSDAAGMAAKVESIASIPSSDGSRDELWVIVQRYINGASVRQVEYLTKFFDEEDDLAVDQFFVDAGLTYDGPAATTISGLDHLEGETVSILADGAVVPDKTVSSGSITLDTAAEKVHVGLGYNSDGQMLRIEAGAADGTALGKTRRIHRLGFLFWRTGGWQFGPDFNNLDEIIFRLASDSMDQPVPLFTGIKSETVNFPYDFDNRVHWRQNVPLNGTLLAVMPQMKTEDRG